MGVRRSGTVFLSIIVALSGLGSAYAADSALLRLDATGADDRNALIDRGVHVVADLGTALLAVGDAAEIGSAAADRGLVATLLAPEIAGRSYALVGVRGALPATELVHCGEILTRDRDWVLVELAADAPQSCLESPQWFVRKLDLSPLARVRQEPLWMRNLAGDRQALEVDPLVADMVAGLSDARALELWQAVVGSASTRYSTSQGCSDAAAAAHAFLVDLGLEVAYQQWSASHAPNVVASIPATGSSDEIIVVVGHLDDMPSSGNAPGADDNASGAAMVLAVAEAMAGHCYTREVRFILVTGEEFGLYGSEHDADQAAANGDNIIAVLNGDMIGWDGGNAATEDLDLNTNSASAALGAIFAASAADYATGCVVNAFSCASMVYSDHASYWDHGYPAVCGITDNEGFCGQGDSYDYYHTANDTIANCGAGAVTFFGGAVRAYLAAAAHLADPIAAIPDTPSAVSALAAGDNTIELGWTAGPGGASYEVYRAAGGCAAPGLWTRIGDTTTGAYTDSTVSGGVTYAYAIRAVDPTGGCSSPDSPCVEAITTGSCSEAPDFAGAVRVVNLADTHCSLRVEWVPGRTFCGDAPTYNVYRSSASGFSPAPENLVASGVVGAAFQDRDALADSTPAFYVVRAVDPATLVEETNQRQVSASPTGPISTSLWHDDAGDSAPAQLSMANPWSISSSGGNLAPHAYTTGAYGTNLCGGLRTPPLSLGDHPHLDFSSWHQIEAGWDKGEVQISSDGGGSWTRIELAYPELADHTGDSCGLPSGSTYFTGSGLGYADYSAALDPWAGQEVLIRWLFSSDTSLNDAGWRIDDIAVTLFETAAQCTPGEPALFADDFESGNTGNWSASVTH